MLDTSEFIQTFLKTQRRVVEITERVAFAVKPGMTELEIACQLQDELNELSLSESWYPILICAGENSGKPISRRFHLPSQEARIRDNDIVVVDCTPIQGTVWWNWSKTVAIGTDPFFQLLCDQCDEVAQSTLDFGMQSASTIGDLFDFCTNLISEFDLVLLDSRNDFGHSIFQVPEGQKVEDTPLEDRLFISEDYRHFPIEGIISIEPQLGRKHPGDGKMYGAKQQRVLIKGEK
jgi:Xaa-Pro aminopeptidase